MKKFLIHFPAKFSYLVIFIALAAFLIKPSTANAESTEADASEVQALKLKVETLKQRVKELEAINKSGGKTKKSAGSRWKSLEVGQTKQDISAILGKAGMVHKWKTGEAWYYPNPQGGEVDFDANGKVTGWLEP